MLDISTFKARNQEAQKINISIQQARGGIEENKRQFAELCAKYKATYNQDITAENLPTILAECEADVKKQTEEQVLAIERAKAGIVVPSSGTYDNNTSNASDNSTTTNGVSGGVENTSNSAQPAVGGASVQSVAQQANAGTQNGVASGVDASATPEISKNFSDPVNNPVNISATPTTPVTGVVAGNNPQPAVTGVPATNSVGVFTPQPTAPVNPVGILPNAPVAPAPTQMNNPISASSFGAAALQSATPVDTKMPATQAVAPAPIQPTQQVAGWGNQPTPDFNAILGGKFGG